RKIRACSHLTSFITATATAEVYTLSLHDALPIFFCLSGRKYGASSTGWNQSTPPVCWPPTPCGKSSCPAVRLSATGSVFQWKTRSEEHTSELQSRENLVCRLLLEKKKIKRRHTYK